MVLGCTLRGVAARSVSKEGHPLHCIRQCKRFARRHAGRNHKKFFDKVKLTVKAGNGGQGHVSHDRTPLHNKDFKGNGPPDGGDGGKGGDVYISVQGFHSDLRMQRYNISAENGRNGKNSSRNGRNGKDFTIEVPRGTVVKLLGDKDPKLGGRRSVTLEMDLMDENETLFLCHGGKGGIGNQHSHRKYTSAQRPWEKEWQEEDVKGEQGQLKYFELELKTIADVGLVGFPNAGKSTLLDAVSNARPMVAAFPFTTLNPILGVLKTPDDRSDDEYQCVIADIPGLIEGAHENKGLGHEFLRHIERTEVLLYVLDIAGSEFRDPVEDFETLQQELSLYTPRLMRKPSFIFANKTDLNPDKCKENITRLREITDIPVFSGSAKEQTNLVSLTSELKRFVGHQKSLKKEYHNQHQHLDFSHMEYEMET